jgi:2-keto-4-pentenoate hydratase/2-oxohepta-3-ene-1,7-dioic acid hydratase in catechol pathway
LTLPVGSGKIDAKWGGFDDRSRELNGETMPLWARVSYQGRACFGTIVDNTIALHAGDMFANPRPTGESIPRSAAKLLTPTVPSKMVALVDNYHALVAKLGHAVPAEPLYFLKANNSFLAGGEAIRTPQSYDGKVLFEGELGIVIGKRCRAVDEANAASYIFGYTCVNDVTAVDILNKEPGFAQWTRAKSFDTFGVFGPVIATDVDPATLVVRTILNDQERQSYPVADAIFAPAQLVSLISRDLTLEAGDVIACGTSIGVGSMKPGSTISIVIDGIGMLSNRFD